MFLYLRKPGGDKHISLYASNLAGDEGFRETCAWYEPDSDRSRFDSAVNRCNRLLGKEPRRDLIFMIFNQFRWADLSGWEFWTDDFVAVLKLALVVSARLNTPLHVHENFICDAIDAAAACGIKFEPVVAQPVANPRHKEFCWTNRDLAAGQFYLLTEVALPAELTAAVTAAV